MIVAKFWISETTDVIVTAYPERQLIEFDLSGMTDEEARRTVFCVLDAATQTTNRVTLISDLNMEDFQGEWADYVRGQREEMPYEPDMIFAPVPRAESRTLTIKASSFLGPMRP